MKEKQKISRLNTDENNPNSKISPKYFKSKRNTKYYLYFIFFLISSISTYSADIGINFSAVMQPTYLNNQFSIITGGRVGFNFSPEFYAGLALYSTTLFKNKVSAIDNVVNEEPILEITYYGMDVEYFLAPKNMIHLSVASFVGWSNTFFNIPAHEDENGVRYKPDYLSGEYSLIIKPTINLNLNIKDFYRIVIGLSYRYIPNFEYSVPNLVNISDNQPYKITSDELNGLAINVVVKFGNF